MRIGDCRWMVLVLCLLPGCNANDGIAEHKTLIPIMDSGGYSPAGNDVENYIPWTRPAKDALATGTLDVGDGEIDGGAPDSDLGSDSDRGSGALHLPAVPSYSGGSCATMTTGDNELVTGASLRQFQLFLPEAPSGKPVLFLWHDQGQTAEVFAQVLGAPSLAEKWDLLVVVPRGRVDFEPWGHADSAKTEQDLLFFYDLLSCLHSNFSVDRGRLYSLGLGAGASWGGKLVASASEFLAASALFNVDSQNIASAVHAIPIVVAWGGPGVLFDLFGNPHNYAQIGAELGAALVQDGHSVLACEHGAGANMPLDLLSVTLPLLLDRSWTAPPPVFPADSTLLTGCVLY